jgi:hypothetical protein
LFGCQHALPDAVSVGRVEHDCSSGHLDRCRAFRRVRLRVRC